MEMKLLRVFLIFVVVVFGGILTAAQFRPTMPPRPSLPTPMRPPVISVGMGGQMGVQGGGMNFGCVSRWRVAITDRFSISVSAPSPVGLGSLFMRTLCNT